MADLLDSILNYLEMESTGTLMVSGEWGCGKTYHIEKIVIPTLIDKGYNPVKVSLFGIESVNEIPFRIAENYKSPNAQSEEVKSNWLKRNKGKTVSKVAQGLSSIKWLENFVDVKSLVNNHSSLLYDLIPTEKTVIFLDDIERVIDTIDIHILLGAINNLVEQRGYKVIVIANNSYFQEQNASKLVFKEKVIEKTLVYKPNVLSVFKELCADVKYSASFREFMANEQALSVIDPSFPSYMDDQDVETNLQNIRIIKFAISHFCKIFETCESFLKDEDKAVVDPFLLSLWACTVGLSIECKKNRLTYGDRNQFVNYVIVPTTILDLSDENDDKETLFEENENKKSESEKQSRQYAQGRVAHIFAKFVKTHNLPQIVSPQLFDFITAGVSLTFDDLKTIWDKYKAEVKRNTTNPAYSLLQQIMLSQWEMSNSEMVEALKRLLEFVKEGAFDDNMAYVNSATYLQHFCQLIDIDQTDIQKSVKDGIDKMYEKRTSLNVLEKTNLEVVTDEVPRISKWVVEYEKRKMDEISASSLKTDIEEACRQFNEDLPALAGRMTIQSGQTKTPDFIVYPILKHISEDDIVRKVNAIQPKDVMALYHLLKSRFIETVIQAVYDEELTFVRIFESALEQRKPEKKEYADYLIEEQLLPLIRRINR